MTHLEDLWNSYPTSEPPTITAGPAPRRVGRLALVGAAAIATAATLVVVTSGSGPHAPGTAAPVSEALATSTQFRYAAFHADLKPAASCDALLASYRQRAMTHVTSYGWDGGPVGIGAAYAHGNVVPQAAGGTTGLNSAMKRVPDAASLLGQSNSATGTNVQEIGVDEPDTVKASGDLIARVIDNTLAVYDASGATIRPRGVIALPYLNGGSILMSGNVVVVAGSDANPSDLNGGTRVDTVSLADADQPRLTSSTVYAGGQITAIRQQGSVIRLVMSATLPALPFVQSQPGVRTDAQALAANKQLVSRTTLKDWLPTYDTGTGIKQLLPCDRVAVPPAGVPLGTTSILSFNAGAPTAINSVGVAGTLTNAYESQHNLYLTVGGSGGGCYSRVCPMYAGVCCFNGGDPGPTTILQFALDGVHTTHVATGQVAGSIQNSWSMDEAYGSLRVALTRYTAATQVNELVTMVPRGAHLVVSGRLAGLGRNQTLTAARWFDNLAILSTANQMDPLYTIDLTDPAHPKELGALHLPGQTVYIHPISAHRFLTVSQQSINSPAPYAQVALFDTTDLTNVRQLGQVSAGPGTWGLVAQDAKSFTWLPDRATALTGITGPSGMFLGAYAVTGESLRQSISIPLTGNDTGPRTFETARGKVVLVFGGTVTFLSM